MLDADRDAESHDVAHGLTEPVCVTEPDGLAHAEPDRQPDGQPDADAIADCDHDDHQWRRRRWRRLLSAVVRHAHADAHGLADADADRLGDVAADRRADADTRAALAVAERRKLGPSGVSAE